MAFGPLLLLLAQPPKLASSCQSRRHTRETPIDVRGSAHRDSVSPRNLAPAPGFKWLWFLKGENGQWPYFCVSTKTWLGGKQAGVLDPGVGWGSPLPSLLLPLPCRPPLQCPPCCLDPLALSASSFLPSPLHRQRPRSSRSFPVLALTAWCPWVCRAYGSLGTVPSVNSQALSFSSLWPPHLAQSLTQSKRSVSLYWVQMEEFLLEFVFAHGLPYFNVDV